MNIICLFRTWRIFANLIMLQMDVSRRMVRESHGHDNDVFIFTFSVFSPPPPASAGTVEYADCTSAKGYDTPPTREVIC